ncbi:MAG TPA: cytochrome C oxidase subunit II [Terriglobales bacterium]|nr:cytochrome C oxidase subunit II [Terriglobales bacterium]
MALLLAVLILLIALGTVAMFLLRHWMPAVASGSALAFDHQFHVSLWWMGGAFLLSQLLLALIVWRFRNGKRLRRGAVAIPFLELGAMVAATALYLWMGATGGMFASTSAPAESASALHIEVTGVQFAWYFRYAGADGKFGSIRPELIDASVGNPLGLDRRDPAARDDVVSSQLVIPANRPVELTLHSQDVVHSFYIPQMRTQMNAVPGMTTHLLLNVSRIGTIEVDCTQLCGLGHYRMKAVVRVLSPQDFAAWKNTEFAHAAAKAE